jgi:hypothetical protein
MKRQYHGGDAESITYFTGIEIEKTPAFGMKTLFDDEHLVRSNTKNHWLKNNHFNRKTIK